MGMTGKRTNLPPMMQHRSDGPCLETDQDVCNGTRDSKSPHQASATGKSQNADKSAITEDTKSASRPIFQAIEPGRGSCSGSLAGTEEFNTALQSLEGDAASVNQASRGPFSDTKRAFSSIPSSASAPSDLCIADSSYQGRTFSNSSIDCISGRLISGRRSHPVSHEDRPHSAPPEELRNLSDLIFDTMRKKSRTCSLAESLRLVGDQLTFETDLCRVLSSSALDKLERDKKH